MEKLYGQFQDQVEFFAVYVQEAHPTDGWQIDSNVAESVLFRQHQNFDEREEAAQTCSIDLHISIPTLVEEMDNAIDEAYGAAPTPVLDRKRRQCLLPRRSGPHLFDLDELDEAIKRMEATVKVS